MNQNSGTILVVDDSRTSRLALAETLRQQGYEVALAASGDAALEMVTTQEYDLMLLDILMPEPDGFGVMEQMHHLGLLHDLPVIVVSALDDIEHVVRGIEMGAEDYLTKPINEVLLSARIGACLEKRRLRVREQAYIQKLREEREQLRKYARELQASNEDLDAFAHMVAHDIRGPLAVMDGCAELLELEFGDDSPLSAREYLRAIRDGANKMTEITNSLLLLAGVRHTERVQLHTLDMRLVVAETLKRLAKLIDEKGGEIVQPDRWPSALGYGPWIEEVWANYLSNALQYGGTPPRIQLGGTEQPDGMVRFWTRDNGPGLSKQEQESLFVPSVRLEPMQANGHGLGLSIVKRIVEKLGGEVSVFSEPGRGSIFSFTLPQS